MSDDLTREDREGMELIDAAYRPYRFNASRPLRPRPLRPWLIATATVAVVIVVAGITWRPPSALASWTSIPTASDPEARAATVTACRQHAARLIRVAEEAEWPSDAALKAMGHLPLVAHDQRGLASAALFAEQATDSLWTCAIIPVAGQPPYVELSGGTGMIPEDVGQIEIWAATAGWNGDYGGRWEIAGRVESEVARVTIVTEDGRTVIGTVADGWFLAWWPTQSEPVRIELRAAGGEHLESIELGDRYSQEPSCRVSFWRICVWER